MVPSRLAGWKLLLMHGRGLLHRLPLTPPLDMKQIRVNKIEVDKTSVGPGYVHTYLVGLVHRGSYRWRHAPLLRVGARHPRAKESYKVGSLTIKHSPLITHSLCVCVGSICTVLYVRTYNIYISISDLLMMKGQRTFNL